MNTKALLAKFTQKFENLCKAQNNPPISSISQPQKQLDDQQPPLIDGIDGDKSENKALSQNQSEGSNQQSQPKKSSHSSSQKNIEGQDMEVDLISSEKQQAMQDKKDQKKSSQIGCEMEEQPAVFENPGNIPLDNEIDYYNRSASLQEQNLQFEQNNQADIDLLKLIKMKIQKDTKLYEEIAPSSTQRNQSIESFDMNPHNAPQNYGEQKNAQVNLSDGRQYNAAYKRQFVKKLLKSLKNQTPEKVNEMIKNAAHGIQVHLYEVKIWLTAHRLIFNIERYIQEQKNQPTPAEKMGLIKKQILNFLMKNQTEKKYRVVKILNCMFQAFNFGEIRSHAWFNQFLVEYAKDLKNIDILCKQSKPKSKSSDEEGFQDKQKKVSKQANGKKVFKNELNYQQQQQVLQNMVPKKKLKVENKGNAVSSLGLDKIDSKRVQNLNRYDNKIDDPFTSPRPQSVSMYPIIFKKKFCQKMNEQMYQAIDNIFKSKSEEFCLSYNSIKCIYQQNGKFVFGYRNTLNENSNQPLQANFQKNENLLQKNLSNNSQQLKDRQNSNSSQRPINSLSQSKQISRPENNMTPKMNENNRVAMDNSQPALFSKLQSRLLAFLKNNMNCQIGQLQRETESNMEGLKFPQKWKIQVRNQWFCLFLRKNKMMVSSDRRVVRIQPQIANNQPTNRPNLPQSQLHRPTLASTQANPNMTNLRPINSRPMPQFEPLKKNNFMK